MTDDPNRPSSAGTLASDASDASESSPPSQPSSTAEPSPGLREGIEGNAKRERRGPPPNPLYHPLFLPVLLVGFSLWFFWDGFVTSDPDMLKHQLFNRISFGITAVLCLRVVPRGIREYREDRDAAKDGQ